MASPSAKISYSDVVSRYEDKIKDLCHGVDPYNLKITDCKDPLPTKVAYFDVVNYYVNKDSSYTFEKFKVYKALDAYMFYESGWIEKIGCKKITNGWIIIGMAHLGPLSPDFLRISTPRDIQEQADRQAALALYQQQAATTYMAPNIIGRLSITIAQAKLVRNYGLTRMDPYVRVRVGHFVYETQTDPNGGKNPRWNRVIQSQLPTGVNSIYVEIYDECSFKMDELVAWTEIKIPEAVLRGETHEDWYALSGKQGEGVEGMIDMVLSFTTTGSIPTYTYQSVAPVVMVPNVSGRPMPVFIAPQQPQVAPITPVPPQPISEEDMKQVQEMFPNIDPEVVKSVFEANRGNKNTTINSLLQMTDQ